MITTIYRQLMMSPPSTRFCTKLWSPSSGRLAWCVSRVITAILPSDVIVATTCWCVRVHVCVCLCSQVFGWLSYARISIHRGAKFELDWLNRGRCHKSTGLMGARGRSCCFMYDSAVTSSHITPENRDVTRFHTVPGHIGYMVTLKTDEKGTCVTFVDLCRIKKDILW